MSAAMIVVASPRPCGWSCHSFLARMALRGHCQEFVGRWRGVPPRWRWCPGMNDDDEDDDDDVERTTLRHHRVQ